MIKRAKLLNHLNFSGMMIDETHMFDLAHACRKSLLLMSIHLNDNGIAKRMDYFTKMLEIFDLSLNDFKCLLNKSTKFARDLEIEHKRLTITELSKFYSTCINTD